MPGWLIRSRADVPGGRRVARPARAPRGRLPAHGGAPARLAGRPLHRQARRRRVVGRRSRACRDPGRTRWSAPGVDRRQGRAGVRVVEPSRRAGAPSSRRSRTVVGCDLELIEPRNGGLHPRIAGTRRAAICSRPTGVGSCAGDQPRVDRKGGRGEDPPRGSAARRAPRGRRPGRRGRSDGAYRAVRVDWARRGGSDVGLAASGRRLGDDDRRRAGTLAADRGTMTESAPRFMLVYDGFDPAEEGLRETLTSTGNGYFCTRGTAEWEDAGDDPLPGHLRARDLRPRDDHHGRAPGPQRGPGEPPELARPQAPHRRRGDRSGSQTSRCSPTGTRSTSATRWSSASCASAIERAGETQAARAGAS